MPKGQSPKFRGSKCNILISKIDSNFRLFPSPVNTDGVFAVKSKRSVEYRRYVRYEPVRARIEISLNYVQENHNLYQDI